MNGHKDDIDWEPTAVDKALGLVLLGLVACLLWWWAFSKVCGWVAQAMEIIR